MLWSFYFIVALVTNPLIGRDEYHQSLNPINGEWKRASSTMRYPSRYHGMPIPYYSNSSACFQLTITLSGDVQLNPGPLQMDKQLHLQIDGDHAHSTHHQIQYDVSTLHRLNRPHQMLPRVTWNAICDLGIGRQKRTHRGRRAPKFRQHEVGDNESVISDHRGSLASMVSGSSEADDDDDDEQREHSKDSSFYSNFQSRGLKIAHLNICSLFPKCDHLREKFVNKPFDVLTFSETHLDSTICDAEIQLDGYSVERNDRNRRGGGVAAFVSNTINYIRKYEFEHPDIESVWVEIKLTNSRPILIGTFYRPPKSGLDYYEVIDDTISKAIHTGNVCYILGDFNYNLYCKRDSRVVRQLCNQNNLHQMIDHPTRVTENSSTLIDLILTNRPCNIREKNVISHGLSDHRLVYVVCKHFRPKAPPRVVRTRAFKRLNVELFRLALQNANLESEVQEEDVESGWNRWKNTFIEICNRHAPVVSLRVRGINTPWVTPEFVRLSY